MKTITDTNINGYGITKDENEKIVFVKNAVKNDQISYSITKINRKYSFAKIDEIIHKSNYRNNEYCKSCGSCSLSHISYSYEKEIKENHIKNCLQKNGIRDFQIGHITNEVCSNYRNKAVLHFSNGKFGYYEESTHNYSFPSDNYCALLPSYYKNIICYINETINNYITCPTFLYIRSSTTNEVMITLGSNEKANYDTLKHYFTKLKTIQNHFTIVSMYNAIGTTPETSNYIHIAGNKFLQDSFCNVNLEISPESFYQINHNNAEEISNYINNSILISPNEYILDLYCGIGTFGLSIAKNNKFAKVIGLEINQHSIDNAITNAKINNINNISFHCTKSANVTSFVDSKKISSLIIDPPRFGCTKETLDNILNLSPKQIIYVSCNPVSLSSNLKNLLNEYKIDHIQPFDLFPKTSHVETVALLSRAAK